MTDGAMEMMSWYCRARIAAKSISMIRSDVRWSTPLEFSADEPRVTLPSLKLTLPMGVPEDAVTVAVNVTAWPYVEGFRDEATVMVVATCAWPQDENLNEPMRVFQLPD